MAVFSGFRLAMQPTFEPPSGRGKPEDTWSGVRVSPDAGEGDRRTGRLTPSNALRAQELENSEHAARILPCCRQSQLLEDLRDVLLDRAHRDDERVGDALVRAARGHELEYLPLSRGQPGDRVVESLPLEQHRHNLGVD